VIFVIRFTSHVSRITALSGKRIVSAFCYEVRDRRSKRRIARHPAATPAVNIAPTIQPEEKPVRLGSRWRSSRLRFGIWDSGPSHSSSDEWVEPFLKRMAVFPSLMIPMLSYKPTHTNPTSAAGATSLMLYENQQSLPRPH
jgi:hypothetical protein